MSSIANLVTKQTIKEYANGAAKQANLAVAEFLAPTVQVPGMVGYYKTFNAKSARRIPNTKRAINGRAAEIFRDATDTAFLLEANALDAPVDEALLKDETAFENELMSAADECAEVGALAHEKEVIDLALTTVGSGTNVNFTSDSIDPVKKLDEQIHVVLLAAGGGQMEVGVLFGPTAWERTKNNALVRARFIGGAGAKNGKAGDGGASLVTPNVEGFSTLLSGPNTKCNVSWMVYDNAPEGKTASYAWLLDTAILIFVRKAAPTRNSPDFMKTLRPRGAWMVPGYYKREDGRAEVAKMDWYAKAVVTNSAAAARINATNS